MSPLRKKLWRDLWRMKSQVLSVSILVAVGIALMISALTAYRSLSRAQESFYARQSFADIFVGLTRVPSDFLARLKAIQGVSQIQPRIVISALLDLPGQIEPAVGEVVSLARPNEIELNRVEILSGKMPEANSEVLEVLVHPAFAEAHRLTRGSEFELQFEGKKHRVRVSGVGISPEYVYALGPQSPLPDDRHFGVLWASISEMESRFGFSGTFNSLVGIIAKGASHEQVRAQFESELAEYGGAGSYLRARQASAMFIKDEILQQRVSAIFMPSVFMAIAAFLLQVTLGRVIEIQRSQIATLRACGYSRMDIAIHYLEMVSIIAVIGVILGEILGIYLGRVMVSMYTQYFRFPGFGAQFSGTLMALGFVVGLLPSWLAVTSALFRAYNLSPAEAMRPPIPPEFSASLVESTPLWEKMTVVRRHQIRNVLARPLRFLFASLGVSMGGAVVVMSLIWSDSITDLVTLQFQTLQREDLAVSLRRPRPPSILTELLHKDGVWRAEGYRSLGVRAQFRGRSRRTTLWGLPEDAEMRALRDLDLRLLNVAPVGLTMSKALAERLGAREGDSIELSRLDQDQRSWSATIRAIIAEPIGSSIYVPIDDFWRYLDEPPGYNYVLLKVDSAKRASLHADLKSQPEVAALFFREHVYRMFKATFLEVMNKFMMIILGFALILAGGVAYNIIRITLSERSWEVASLRILGYSAGEVFGIFFGEWMVVLVLGLLPGVGIGWLLAQLSIEMINTEVMDFTMKLTLNSWLVSISVVSCSFAVSVFWGWRRLKRIGLVEALKLRE